MSRIFISYAREDRSTAEKLAHALESKGWAVWWDADIPTGQSFDDVIDKAIDDAKCVVVLWSKASVDSRYVRGEAQDAAERGILMPAMIDKDIRIPRAFRSIQAADLVGWDGTQTGSSYKKLEEDIARILVPPPGGRRLSQTMPLVDEDPPAQPVSRPVASPRHAAAPPGSPPTAAPRLPASPATSNKPFTNTRRLLALALAAAVVVTGVKLGRTWYANAAVRESKAAAERARLIAINLTPTPPPVAEQIEIKQTSTPTTSTRSSAKVPDQVRVVPDSAKNTVSGEPDMATQLASATRKMKEYTHFQGVWVIGPGASPMVTKLTRLGLDASTSLDPPRKHAIVLRCSNLTEGEVRAIEWYLGITRPLAIEREGTYDQSCEHGKNGVTIYVP